MSFTSVLETEHFVLSFLYWYQKGFCVIFLPLPPLFQPLYYEFLEKFRTLSPNLDFSNPSIIRYSRVISSPYSFFKVIYLAAIKNRIILIIYIYIKFMSGNCLSIIRPLKQLSKVSIQCCSNEYFFVKFSANYYEFILSKIPCFSFILLNTFRRMRFKYDNYSLRGILFYVFKKYSYYKRLISKTFNEKTLKMKTTCPV